MLQFYQKRTWRIIISSPLAIIVLVFVLLFLARIVYERYTIERAMATRRLESELRLESLVERKAQLQQKVEYLSNDRGIEAEMRRNFDVARPGEQVVIILDKEPDANIQPLTPMNTGETNAPWYQFWR